MRLQQAATANFSNRDNPVFHQQKGLVINWIQKRTAAYHHGCSVPGIVRVVAMRCRGGRSVRGSFGTGDRSGSGAGIVLVRVWGSFWCRDRSGAGIVLAGGSPPWAGAAGWSGARSNPPGWLPSLNPFGRLPAGRSQGLNPSPKGQGQEGGDQTSRIFFKSFINFLPLLEQRGLDLYLSS